MVYKCRLCGSFDFELLIDFGLQPIAHRLVVSQEDQFRHPLTIHYCTKCGLAQIKNPIDPEKLYREFNYCFSEWKPEPHRETELGLISGLSGVKSVFEVGCNDGLFLESLKRRGIEVCVGIEPNQFAWKYATERRGLDVYNSFLDVDSCDQAIRKHGKFGLVVARQVLEHLPDIGLFFRCVDMLLDDDGALFLDVPDIGTGLEVGDCTIAWEEHVNYFTDSVLARMLQRFGYMPIQRHRFDFSGGTLAMLARRRRAGDPGLETQTVPEAMRTFSRRVDAYGARLREILSASRNRFDQVVIYGVGCRACALVNCHKLGPLIDFAVDDQLERQGKFMPGSNLEIKSPEVLQANGGKTLVILAVNHENEAHVMKKTAKSVHGSQLAFLVVFGPSDIGSELDRFGTPFVSA
jgi:2-polyprenyl-3-methyl-5-hydroxy-6-metoxy-1,4-benzoquinol methylase